jgi:ABC-type antimicrobial peptide transport system permease subunit
MWVAGADEAALAVAPYDRLQVMSQSIIRDRIAADPVGQGSAGLLAVGALVALLVGAAALVLLVVGSRRDDAGELLALESDGVGPATLRRVLFLRAAYVAVPSVVAGVATGLLLARAATTLVAVSGTGTTPVPPLTLAVGALWTAAVVGIGVLVALSVAAATAAATFRTPWPARAQEELR